MIERLTDKLLDGRWKYVSRNSKTTLYTFQNIYNKEKIKLSHRQVKMVLDGKDTVAHITTRRIYGGRTTRQQSKTNPNWWTNNINRQFGKQVNKNTQK